MSPGRADRPGCEARDNALRHARPGDQSTSGSRLGCPMPRGTPRGCRRAGGTAVQGRQARLRDRSLAATSRRTASCLRDARGAFLPRSNQTYLKFSDQAIWPNGGFRGGGLPHSAGPATGALPCLPEQFAGRLAAGHGRRSRFAWQLRSAVVRLWAGVLHRRSRVQWIDQMGSRATAKFRELSLSVRIAA